MEEIKNITAESAAAATNAAENPAKPDTEENRVEIAKDNNADEKEKAELSEKTASLEAEIKKLKEENARQKSKYEAAIKKHGTERAAEDIMRREGAKNPRLLLKLIDLSAAELDEKGEIKGLVEQLKALKRDEPYLFDNKSEKTHSCFRPEEASDFSETAKPDISQMTYSQMIKLM